MTPKTIVILAFLIITLPSLAQNFQFQKIEINNAESFRALSVVNDKVAWIGGSKGYVGNTTDGGHTWTFTQVKGFEKFEFRSVYAFDENKVIIANAGSPAQILFTSDKGKTWKTVYTNSNEDAFFDGIDFWNNKEGIIYGDPIEGKMLLLKTKDGGLTWTAIGNAPTLEKGEASFAASGTGIRCYPKNEIMICTGGTVSRLWISKDKGEHWNSLQTPIIQGESATGIFSFVKKGNRIIIIGGDYQKDTQTIKHHFYSTDGGQSWHVPDSTSRGYRECVEFIAEKTFITVGPTGLEISIDNGVTWKPLSDEKGLHVIRKARKGSLLLAAGAKGQLFIIKY